MATSLTIRPLEGLPIVRAGDDLSVLISDALARSDMQLDDGDVVVVAQKIVSLSEDRLVRLSDVHPSAEALRLAAETNGEFWKFPTSTSVPKPLQKPHPPIWVAARAPITFDYSVRNNCNILSWPLTR